MTGMTEKNVKVRAVKKRKRGRIELEVRVEAVEGETKKTSATTAETVFYPAVVEYGRENEPPNPFMRRAFTEAGESARQTTIQDIKAGVEIEAGRS